MWFNIGYYATLAFESVIGIFGIRLYEEPRYDIVARLGDRVEIRRYAPRLAAEVELSGAGQAKMDEAFRLLFAYIAGANQAKESGGAKIAMTVPRRTAHERKDGDDGASSSFGSQRRSSNVVLSAREI